MARENKNFRFSSAFRWTEKKGEAAMLLAQGYTQQQVAEMQGVTDRAIRLWLAEVEFSQEVDRLSLMIGVAARAERLRIAQRIVRDKMSHGILASDKDLLDWLKFAQSETDGIKLDLAAAFAEVASSLAGGGSEGADRKGQAADRAIGSAERNLS